MLNYNKILLCLFLLAAIKKCRGEEIVPATFTMQVQDLFRNQTTMADVTSKTNKHELLRTDGSILYNGSQNLNAASDDIVQETVNWLQFGEDSLLIGPYRDSILVFGNQDEGKKQLIEILTRSATDEYEFELRHKNASYPALQNSISYTALQTEISEEEEEFFSPFPVLHVQEYTSLNYYDMPRFNNFFNVTDELTSRYLLDKIVSSSDRLKVIFTLNVDSMNDDSDIPQIIDMSKFLEENLLDYDLVNKSVSMVVTNILSEEPDEQIILKIIQRLTFIKDSQTDSFTVLFLENLIGNACNLEPKVSFSRQYAEYEDVSDMEKKYLHFFIANNVEYTNTVHTIFNYQFSEEATLITKDLTIVLVNNKIELSESYFNKSVEGFSNQILLIKNETEVYKYVENSINEIVKVIEEKTWQMSNAGKFVLAMHTIGIDLELYDVVRFTYLRRQETFFKGILYKQLYASNLEIIWLDYMKADLSFYDSLLIFTKECSSYALQNYFRSVDLSFAGSVGFYEDVSERLTNMDQTLFWQMVNNEKPYNQQKLQLIIEKKVLWTPTVSIDGHSYKETSTFIFLSEVVSRALQRNATNIVVMAADTIFIDKDIVLNSTNEVTYELYLFGNTWHIEHDVDIKLNGDDGTNHISSRADTGKNGLPGKAGSSGGNLQGFSTYFTGNGKLNIETHGGAGGIGQDGGSGAEGVNGVNPSIYVFFDRHDCYVSDRYNEDIRRQPAGVTSARLLAMNDDGVFQENDNFIVASFNGTRGKNGGDGGAGGVSGHGGLSGHVDIFSYDKQLRIHVSTSIGRNNFYGSGGIGASGGTHGNNQIVYYGSMSRIGNRNCRANILSTVDQGRASTGKMGTDNSSSIEQEQPKENSVNKKVWFNNMMNYKSFIIEQYLSEDVNNVDFELILKMFSTRNATLDQYSVLDLADELIIIEGLPKTHQTSKLIKIYEFYRDTLEIYIEQKLQRSDTDSLKVCNYLYATTLSRISYISHGIQTSLIIDVEAFINKLQENVIEFNTYTEQITTSQNVDKYRDDYKASIDGYIKNCNDLVDNMEKVINQLLEENTQEIDKLVDEVIAYQEETIANINEAEIAQANIEIEYRKKKILGVFEVVGSVGSVFTDIGGTMTDMIDVAGSMIPETEITEGLEPPTNLKDGFGEMLESIDTNFMSLIETDSDDIRVEIEKVISDLQNDISIDSVKVFIETSETFLESIPDINVNNYMTLYAELKEKYLLDIDLILQLELRNSSNTVSKKPKFFVALVAGIQVAQGVVSSSLALAGMYKEEQEKLEILNQVIAANKAELEKLYQFERDIYNILIPVMLSLQMEINTLLETDASSMKSLAALDVLAFSITMTMKDILFTIETFTEEFEIQGEMLHTLEKLTDALITVTKVYERIQEYKEQKNFADYLADIVSPDSQYMTIQDQELSKAIRNVDYILRSNLIFDEYKRGIDAFKQWVFPFASLFLEEIAPYDNIDFTKSNVSFLVDTTNRKLDTLIDHLNQYEMSIVQGHDEYIFTAEFSSQYLSSKPFFVWNQKFRYEISELLLGNPVLFKSSILPENPVDSIKFNLVGLQITSQEKNIKKIIHDELSRNYHLSITHMGSSQFKCGEFHYTFNSESQHIEYSFETKSNGEPVFFNEVYRKMKDGSLMLSPYALWKIQLKNITKVDFDKLHGLRQFVYLELEGAGKYLAGDAPICEYDQSEYYIRDMSL